MSDSDDDQRPVYRSAITPPPPSRQPSSDVTALFGLCAEHQLNLVPPNLTPGVGPWWGWAGSASSTQPTTPPDSDEHLVPRDFDAPSLSRTIFPPLPIAASSDMIWHMGSDAPLMLRPTRARTNSSRITSPRKSPPREEVTEPPREEVTDADVDGLANEWANMKVQSEEIRSNLATSMQTMQYLAASNEGILQELHSVDFGRTSVRAASPVAALEPLDSLFVAPCRDASDSTVMVVMSDHSDDEGEEEMGGQEGGAIVVQRVDSDSEYEHDDDLPQNVYRGIDSPDFRPGRSASFVSASSCALSDSSTSASPMRCAHGHPRWPTAQDASAAPGKRSRSVTSQLAAEPLHPSKQRSQPSSVRTTSPLPQARAEAEMKRIEELKALIASEKAELAQLIEAYKENEFALAQVRDMNKSLSEEVTRVRQASARQAQEASG